MERLETKLTLKNVRLSYVNVYEPRAMQGSDVKKYSLVALIDKGDTEAIEAIKQGAANAMRNAGLTGITLQKVMDNLVRDGEEKDMESYNGKFFLSVKSDKKPNLYKKVDGKLVDLSGDTNEEIYSGCYAMVSLNLHAFNVSGNKGVGAYIRAVCKTEDGERLSGGSVNAAEEFGLPFAEKAQDDFSDLM